MVELEKPLDGDDVVQLLSITLQQSGPSVSRLSHLERRAGRQMKQYLLVFITQSCSFFSCEYMSGVSVYFSAFPTSANTFRP